MRIIKKSFTLTVSILTCPKVTISHHDNIQSLWRRIYFFSFDSFITAYLHINIMIIISLFISSLSWKFVTCLFDLLRIYINMKLDSFWLLYIMPDNHLCLISNSTFLACRYSVCQVSTLVIVCKKIFVLIAILYDYVWIEKYIKRTLNFGIMILWYLHWSSLRVRPHLSLFTLIGRHHSFVV